MKLDKDLIKKIQIIAEESIWEDPDGAYVDNRFCERLESLDLVIKSGDSSQSILVENK